MIIQIFVFNLTTKTLSAGTCVKVVLWSKMAELDRSLQSMEWLTGLKPMNHTSPAKYEAGSNKVLGGHIPMRKGPNSPLDTTATYDEDTQGIQKEGKPPYSYANLITFAINSSTKKKMTLSEIYQWICENFPYYKEAGNGWKVRGSAQIFDLIFSWSAMCDHHKTAVHLKWG